jgi:hypothetical protein
LSKLLGFNRWNRIHSTKRGEEPRKYWVETSALFELFCVFTQNLSHAWALKLEHVVPSSSTVNTNIYCKREKTMHNKNNKKSINSRSFKRFFIVTIYKFWRFEILSKKICAGRKVKSHKIWIWQIVRWRPTVLLHGARFVTNQNICKSQSARLFLEF